MTTPATGDAEQRFQRVAVPVAFAFIIGVLVCVSYLPALNAPWVLDSKGLANRSMYHNPQPIWRAVSSNSRSLVVWTFAQQYQLSGPSPRAYTIFNVAIHIAAAWALFGLTRCALLLPRSPELLRQHATELSFAIALLWALHPLQTQAVTYTIQRYEAMMSMFFLLTLYLFVRGTQAKLPLPWYAGAVAACFLGMTSKSVMVVAPLVVLLFDYALVAMNWKSLLKQRWWVHASLLAVALWGLYLERSLFATSAPATTAGLSLKSVTSWEYFRTQPEILLYYLRLAFWPSTLSIDYAWPVQDSPVRYVLSGLVLTALFVASLYGTWRQSGLGFLGLAMFIVLAPTSSFVPILDLAVEHRMYLPLAALMTFTVCVAFTATHRALHDPKARLALQLGMVGFVVVAFMLRTTVRNVDYSDPMRLWTKATIVNPRNPRPFNHLGDLAQERGEVDLAMQQYEHALKLEPRSFAAHVNLATLLQARGRTAEAIDHCLAAIEILPHQAFAYYTLGVCYESQKRAALAKASYLQALERNANFAPAHHNLGMLLLGAGKPKEGIAHLREAVASDPGYVLAMVNLGNAYRVQENWPEAQKWYTEAIRVNPAFAPAQLQLGLTQAHEGDTIGAILSMREAIKLAPESPEAKVRLAWLLATTDDAIFRNGPLAVELAEQAVKLEKKPSVETLESLAAAYAAVGRFEDAATTVEQAIALADDRAAHRDDPDLVNRLKRQQDDYRRRLGTNGK